MWIIKIIKTKCFYPPRILDKHWCIYSWLQIPPRENWFQYVRRVYDTAINFPYITTLVISEVYASLVLQCTVSRLWSKHKTDGVNLSNKIQWNILVIRNYYVNYLNFLNFLRKPRSQWYTLVCKVRL